MAALYLLYRNYSLSDTESVEVIGALPPINAIEDDYGNIYDWTRSGYNFIGYNTAQDGSGTMAQPNESNISGAMYAQWQEQVVIPDIDISLGSTSITTLSASGTIVLDTEGTYLTDDITIEYTKPSATDTVVDFIENHEVYSEYTNSLVTKISPYTFYSCKSLKTVDFQACSIIGASAFANCTSLTTISFPECTQVNSGAFYSCASLSSASLSKCTIIRTSAFYSCKKLSTIYAPTCSNIQASAFYGAVLKSADFPSVSNTIGIQAFGYCSSMETINFPECSSLAASAFFACYKLKSVELQKCKYFAGNAFNNCSSLSIVSLPMMSVMAGSSNFYRCYRLVSLYLLGSSVAKLSNSNTFTSTPIAGYTTSTGGVYGSIYVPSSLYSSYIASTNWTYFSSRFVSV